jgi:hypothetical protein
MFGSRKKSLSADKSRSHNRQSAPSCTGRDRSPGTRPNPPVPPAKLLLKGRLLGSTIRGERRAAAAAHAEAETAARARETRLGASMRAAEALVTEIYEVADALREDQTRSEQQLMSFRDSDSRYSGNIGTILTTVREETPPSHWWQRPTVCSWSSRPPSPTPGVRRAPGCIERARVWGGPSTAYPSGRSRKTRKRTSLPTLTGGDGATAGGETRVAHWHLCDVIYGSSRMRVHMKPNRTLEVHATAPPLTPSAPLPRT